MESVPADFGLVHQHLEVRDDLRQDFAAPAVDAVCPPGPPGLRAWSPVDAVRDGLSLLHGPVFGTRGQLWKRLLELEEIVLYSVK